MIQKLFPKSGIPSSNEISNNKATGSNWQYYTLSRWHLVTDLMYLLWPYLTNDNVVTHGQTVPWSLFWKQLCLSNSPELVKYFNYDKSKKFSNFSLWCYRWTVILSSFNKINWFDFKYYLFEFDDDKERRYVNKVIDKK